MFQYYITCIFSDCDKCIIENSNLQPSHQNIDYEISIQFDILIFSTFIQLYTDNYIIQLFITMNKGDKCIVTIL